MQKVSFKAGETILTEGEEGNTAFLIVWGTVEVTIGEGESAKTVGSLGKGDVFGEMSLLEPGPRSATVTATSDTECTVTSYDEFIDSIQKDPELAVEFMRTMVNRLRQMNALILSMDPQKRSLLSIFRDWQKSPKFSDEGLTDEELQRRNQVLQAGYWM